MATSIDNLTIALRIAGLFVNTNDIGNAEHRISYNPSNQFSDGNADNKAEAIFSDTRTISASGTEDLDLAGSGLVDVFGNTLTFTKIKALLIFADGDNANNVLVGGDGLAAWVGWCGDASDIVSVKPGGIFLMTAPKSAGMPVVATTGDILQIANSSSGTSVTYTIIIVGTDS